NERDAPMSHTRFSQLRKRLPGGAGGSRPAHRKLPSARPSIEALEARLVPTVSILNNFDGLISGAPPDTCGAAGPKSYVETVNSSVTIFGKNGTTIASPDGLSDFLFTQGGLKSMGGLEDATMAYDEVTGQFIVGDLDGGKALDIAVSRTSSPATLTKT